jgi:predicted RNA binding protein YcfA (HicA-like mRNA interferase family)
MSSREVLRALQKAGWKLVRTRGSHQHFKHPGKPGLLVTVPHPKRDLPTGTLKSICKHAGLQDLT